MILLKASVLCFALVLTACSSVQDQYTSFMGGEDNADPPTPLKDIEQRVAITRLWEEDVGGGYEEHYLKLIPVHGQGRIFVADSDGEVQAMDQQSGKTLWNEDTDTPITGGPGTGDNLVVVGTGKADVISFSVDSGEILWRSRVTSEILSAPQVAKNIVIVRTIDGKIFGLNAADGNQLWIYERPVPALTLRGTSSPVIAGDYVIAGFDEGRLAAIELQTGKLIWETRVAMGTGRSELERMVDIDSEPVIMDDVIYVATFQGRIAAISLDSGRILWTREISSYAGIAVDERAVYVTDDDSAVWALDRATGNSLWKQEDLLDRALTAPGISGNLIVVGDLEGYLHWLDKLTGEFVARNQVSESKIIAPPIAVESNVYAYASDGALAAYSNDSAGYVSSGEAILPERESDITDEASEESVADETEIKETVETAEDTEPVETETAEEEEKGFFGRLWDRMTDDEEETD